MEFKMIITVVDEEDEDDTHGVSEEVIRNGVMAQIMLDPRFETDGRAFWIDDVAPLEDD